MSIVTTIYCLCDVGYAALGSTGRVMVLVMAMTEFFGASCMTLIVIWRTIVALLPETGTFILMCNMAGSTHVYPVLRWALARAHLRSWP